MRGEARLRGPGALVAGLVGLVACGSGDRLYIGGDPRSLDRDAAAADDGPALEMPLPPGAPTDSVYLIWLLDDDDLQVAHDASGRGHDGVLEGAPSLSEPAPSRRPGNERGRFFNGTGERARFEGDVPRTAFTLALWVKPAATSSAAVLERRDALGTPMLALSIGPDGHVEVHAEASVTPGSCAQGAACVRSERAVTPDEWSHVAITAEEGGALRLYLDGAREGEAQVEAFASDGSRFTLAPTDDAALAGLRGVLDEVVVYERALSDAQLAALSARDDGASQN